jgi:hypothetical protein
MEPAETVLERLVHGWQLSAALQAYSSAPMNITSGVTTVQGTSGRPRVDGAFIPRNAGELGRFFSLNARVSRAFRLGGHAEAEVMVEGFNLTDHRNVVTRNANFGSGAYPSNPLPSFNQVLAVGEPRAFQLGARIRF